MTALEFRRLLCAPEIIVLDVANAALRALVRALLLEHPLVRNPAHDDDPLIRRRARDILHTSARLRRDVRAYRHIVLQRMRDNDLADEPF
jgi:hypothetical protein